MHKYASIKKTTYELSVSTIKNLTWFNEQVKRVLRYDIRPVSRLYNFQVSLHCCITIIVYLFNIV